GCSSGGAEYAGLASPKPTSAAVNVTAAPIDAAPLQAETCNFNALNWLVKGVFLVLGTDQSGI
ncbi:MAG: hypothetical protein ACLFRT_13115, partial [Actinomycetota bacterium]